MTKNKDVKTCKDCVKRIFCWERSREYPCRSFDDMYSKGHEHEGNKDKHSSTHTSVGTGFGASDSGNNKGFNLLKMKGMVKL